MIDDDLQRLTEQQLDVPLDDLETEVWAAIRQDAVARRTRRVIASCQLFVLVVTLIGSAMFGATTALSPRLNPYDISHAGYSITPSALLLGPES